MKLQVQVMNGMVGVGDRVIWHSKKYGIRKGKVSKMCQETGWKDNSSFYMSVQPDRLAGQYWCNVPLRNLLYICKEFTPEQVAA